LIFFLLVQNFEMLFFAGKSSNKDDQTRVKEKSPATQDQATSTENHTATTIHTSTVDTSTSTEVSTAVNKFCQSDDALSSALRDSHNSPVLSETIIDRLDALEAKLMQVDRVGKERRLRLEVKVTGLQEAVGQLKAEVKTAGASKEAQAKQGLDWMGEERESVKERVLQAEQLVVLAQQLADRAQELASESQDQSDRAEEQMTQAQRLLELLLKLEQGGNSFSFLVVLLLCCCCYCFVFNSTTQAWRF
jgi:hypothetical protein